MNFVYGSLSAGPYIEGNLLLWHFVVLWNADNLQLPIFYLKGSFIKTASIER